jgi:hypothetical protein
MLHCSATRNFPERKAQNSRRRGDHDAHEQRHANIVKFGKKSHAMTG